MCRTVATSGNGDRGVGHVIRAMEGRLGGPGNMAQILRVGGLGWDWGTLDLPPQEIGGAVNKIGEEMIREL